MDDLGTQTAAVVESMKGVNDWSVPSFAVFFAVVMIAVLMFIFWVIYKNAAAREERMENRLDAKEEEAAKARDAHVVVLREISLKLHSIPDHITKTNYDTEMHFEKVNNKLDMMPDKIAVELKKYMRSPA
jgi:flagellar biosynthesis/type III secretory pathway M-ring protein FliF/YscJ